jgi:hypothetical protein
LFEICPLCDWQDDNVQNADPDYAGGANEMSLNEYRSLWETEHHRWEDGIRVDAQGDGAQVLANPEEVL